MISSMVCASVTVVAWTVSLVLMSRQADDRSDISTYCCARNCSRGFGEDDLAESSLDLESNK